MSTRCPGCMNLHDWCNCDQQLIAKLDWSNDDLDDLDEIDGRTPPTPDENGCIVVQYQRYWCVGCRHWHRDRMCIVHGMETDRPSCG